MRRILWSSAAAVVVATAACLAVLSVQIHRESTIDDARAADVIIVLGAAEYRGNPSPVLRARLEHGLDLYRRGLAPFIMTTGGAGGDPSFTEGEVARAWLVRQGVPSEAILVEQEGESTVHSLAEAAEIMRRHSLHSCIVVSDGYHIFRVKKMLQFRGVSVYGSPRPWAPKTPSQEWWLNLRQAVAYLLWMVGISI